MYKVCANQNMKMNSQTISKLAGVGALVIAAGLVQSSSGAVVTLDLLTAGSTAAGPSGSFFKQVATGAGTGNWDPFLSLDSKKGILQGYNTDANASAGSPDIVTGGGRTHSVTFGQLRYTTVGGIDFVRFSLDINEPGNPPEQYLALNDFRIFAPVGPGFANYSGSVAGLGTPLYNMDTVGNDRTVLMDYSLQSGSGVSDMELFVPLSLFGSLAADRSIVVYTRIGDGAGITGYPGISAWGADAGGFEEWRLSTTDKPVAVPEASTYVMAAGLIGGLGIVEVRRRRSQKSAVAAQA